LYRLHRLTTVPAWLFNPVLFYVRVRDSAASEPDARMGAMPHKDFLRFLANAGMLKKGIAHPVACLSGGAKG
jgi:hypothetical protein